MGDSVEERWVRFAHKRGGPCLLLGRYIKRSFYNVTYRANDDGPVSLIAKRYVHLEPCPSCSDHARTRFPTEMELVMNKKGLRRRQLADNKRHFQRVPQIKTAKLIANKCEECGTRLEPGESGFCHPCIKRGAA